MSRIPNPSEACELAEQSCAYALGALPASECSAIEAHLAACSRCAEELAALRPVLDALEARPQDLPRPSASLQERLARRIAADTGGDPVLPASRQWPQPEWEEAAPGISCKLLATDADKRMVSMLVRLAPDTAYPPHTHAAVEELHLLAGELWIEDRLLRPGDYNLGHPGASDQRVWSEPGCICVLITSIDDKLS